MRGKAVLLGAVVALLGLTVASPAYGVYGGKSVEDNRDAFMAVIRMNGSLHCGGTVIAPQYVLTAAHCVDGYDARNFEVRVGSRDQRAGTAIGVRRGVVHPRYKTTNGLYDAAVLELVRPVPPSVPRITLATAASEPLERPGTEVVVAGWGALFYQGPAPNMMREAPLTVRTDSHCNGSDAAASAVEVCAAGFMKSPCYGDSGGPLFYRGPRMKVQIGIVSHGLLPGCNEVLVTQETAYFTEVNNPDVRSFISSIANV